MQLESYIYCFLFRSFPCMYIVIVLINADSCTFVRETIYSLYSFYTHKYIFAHTYIISKLLFELRCLCTFPSLSVFVRLSAKKNFLMDADIKKC